MRLLTVDDCVAIALDAHHQVILAGTLGSVAVMVARRRKPANVGRVDRAYQRVLSCMRENGSRNDEQVLSGKALRELQWLCQANHPEEKTS
jgi:hypothetical protein